MRIFKKRFLKRAMAIFFLIIITESIMHPTLTYALTTGPHQPEYTSYEQPGATDMVNLLTGDFTFSLPILEVPGPEGSFSVPLTYNAGIGPEQEASWVGLGWTLNVGAITREINQYPDDASSEIQSIAVKNLVGVRGWTSKTLGNGQIGWNTAQGHYGAISLLSLINVSYNNNGLTSGGILGVNFSNRGQISFDGAQFMVGAMTIATWGAAGAFAGDGSTFLNVAGKNSLGMLESNALFSAIPMPSSQSSSAAGSWDTSRKEKQGIFHKDYWIWLDQTRQERMYGLLNMQNADLSSLGFSDGVSDYDFVINGTLLNPSGNYLFSMRPNNVGSASDINYYIPTGSTFQDSNSPALLATDNFSVKAPGINGTIQPYRFEIGCVSMPRKMTLAHFRFAPVKYQNYKVPFIYSGTNSNSYLFHTGTNSTSFNYNLSSNVSRANSFANAQVDISLTESTFDTQRMRSDISLTNPEISQSNHIEWYSNDDIISSRAINNGFMDYFANTPQPLRNQFRQNFSFSGNRTFYSNSLTFVSDGNIPLLNSELINFSVGQQVQLIATVYNSTADMQNMVNGTLISPQTVNILSVNNTNNLINVGVPSVMSQYAGKYFDLQIISTSAAKSPGSIGGFSITRVDGLTYHFALPIYDYKNLTWIGSISDAKNIYSQIKRDAPFANTWLLTGITGPDFVDRNANGIIDLADWGYWVKFNYGNYSDNYQWQIPFSGASAPTPDPINSSIGSYTQGIKQLYYLNSIETRSHVALFLKDLRNDNLDAGQTNGNLKLSEISLLTRKDYNTIMATNGILPESGTVNTFWVVPTWAGSNTPYSSANVAPSLVTQNALKRIVFGHDYSLCKLTPNSKDNTTDSNGNSRGKLTLNRVSVIGNLTKVVPDYIFNYGNQNPTYDPNKWDGWGLYNSNGTSANDTHAASPLDANGSAWSLSQITTPQGSTLNINYERDSYSSVSGISTGPTYSFNASTYNEPSFGNTSLTVPSYNGGANPGGKVIINGTMNYSCNGTPVSPSFNGTYYVSSSSASTHSIVVTSPYGISNSCPGTGPIPISYTGTIQIVQDVKGGGVRVSSITLNDLNQTYKTRYLYINDDGSSTGVVAKEASYTKTSTFDYDAIPGYPMTPVIYSKISVLTGSLSTDSDYNTNQVYEFETPNISMIINSVGIITNSFPLSSDGDNYDHVLAYKNEISDYTSKIGSLKSIKVYDKQIINPVSSTILNYSSSILNSGGLNKSQGIFSQGTLMFDRALETTNGTLYAYTKLSRNTVLKYPYALQSIVTTKDGFTSEVDNIAWDFVSGQVVEKNSTSPLGIKTKTVTQPAYSVKNSSGALVYPQMGPKALDVTNNKNMLSQAAAEYVYKLDANGAITGLISGQATTWNNLWNNYRDFNGSAYADGPGSPASSVYRKNQTYVYKGGVGDSQNDGSIKFNPVANAFDFTGTGPNTNWQQTSSVMRYDHYSLPVEVLNPISNLSSSTKRDFNNLFVLASASNANYFEFAYSGAEDWTTGNLFFGGEVALNSTGVNLATVVSGQTPGIGSHTGQAAVQVPAGVNSFVYNPISLTPNRTYRASVWTNSLNGQIYYKINGNVSTVSPQAINKAGNWYKISVDNILIPTGLTSFEVGVTSTSGTVSFDDFRFQPLDGGMQANVYDASTGYLTYTLDNNNMYTRYEYNDAGIKIKTYQESILYGGEKLVKETRYNYRRLNTNQ